MGAAPGRAITYDVEIFRASMEIAGCLTRPREVLARPGLADRVKAVAATHGAIKAPGPTMDELLRLIA